MERNLDCEDLVYDVRGIITVLNLALREPMVMSEDEINALFRTSMILYDKFEELTEKLGFGEEEKVVSIKAAGE